MSINGFDSRFLNWQNKKEVSIEEELTRREERIVNAQTNIVQKQTRDYTSTYTYGTKIYTCTRCGKKADDGKFYMTQGNTGLCWECHYGPERYAEIKKHRGW